MKLFLVLTAATVLSLHAQPVEVGVKGGFVLTNQLINRPDNSKLYTIGGSVEVKLPHAFAIEADVLYKRVGADIIFTFDGPSNIRSRGNSWELPVIGKYYFQPTRGWRPFLGTGWALRRTWQEATTSQDIVRGILTGPTGVNVGAVIATGAQYRYGRLKLAPELRYTRWGIGNEFPRRNPNQLELLFGVSF